MCYSSLLKNLVLFWHCLMMTILLNKNCRGNLMDYNPPFVHFAYDRLLISTNVSVIHWLNIWLGSLMQQCITMQMLHRLLESLIQLRFSAFHFQQTLLAQMFVSCTKYISFYAQECLQRWSTCVYHDWYIHAHTIFHLVQRIEDSNDQI